MQSRVGNLVGVIGIGWGILSVLFGLPVCSQDAVPAAPCSVARIRVTGVGFPPAGSASASQKRLLAERAAVVDAYRQLAAYLQHPKFTQQQRDAIISLSGYVRGAEIMEVRYWKKSGRVEVDLRLEVPIPGTTPVIMHAPLPMDETKEPDKVDTTRRQITEREWLELYNK